MTSRPPDRDPPDETRSTDPGWTSGMGTVAEYAVVGIVFPVALGLGFFLGRWVGSLLGGPMIGAAVGILLGTAAGFYNLWETLQRVARREEREAGR